MKKRRILSILTSVAMAASVVTSTLASTVSAATVVDKDSTMVLRFAPEKTSFTMDEVKAGTARTTVALMCDQYDAAEEVTQILTSFKGSAEGIKFQNINVTDPNAFTVDGGFGMLAMDIEVVGFDPADNTKITDQTGFFIQNGATPFVLGDKNNSIVTFDVIFDSSMAAGTYTVDFMDNFSVNSGTVAGDGTIITTYGNSVNANSEPATFTLGDGTEPTEPSTEPTTEAPDTTTTTTIATTKAPDTTVADTTGNTGSTASREYIGTCDIWADKDVKGAVGEQVEVNFYADTKGNDIRGFEARPIFDTTALKIVGYKYNTGFMAKPTANEELGTYVIASAAAKIKNDPTTPYLTLTFEILEGASGTYPIDIQGCNGAANPVINYSNGGEGTTYLEAAVTPGSIVVAAEGTDLTEDTDPTSETGSTASREYVGTCDIWADKDVKGAVGDQVEVNFYADTKGEDIRGFEARPIFDTSALKIVGYKYSTGFMAKPTANEELGTYVIASAAAKIKNDPTTPYLTLTFEILEGASGTYPIDIQGCNGAANPVINFSNGGEGTTYLTPNVTPGSIVVSGDTTADTDPTGETGTTASREYVGTCDIWADKDVKGAVGDQVEVNFYADTHGEDIRGFEARPIFDTSALKIVGYKYSTGFMAKPTANEDLGTYVIASAAAKIKNDPTTPYLTLTFEILEGASGTYPIDIQGCNGAANPVINFSNGGEGTTYLTPNVTPGSIVVDEETTSEEETTEPKVTTTVSTTTTPKATTTVSTTTTPKATTTVSTTTTPKATTTVSATTTPSNTTSNSGTTASRVYVGTCDIWADKDVKGAVGDKVEVNFYADTHGEDIRGFEARPIFDTSALKIVGYKYSTGFMAKPTANEDLGTYVIASAAAKIKNDPTTPYLTLTFEILEGASGTYEIDIQGCNGAANPVINFSNGGEGTTYLTPNVTPGSIIVDDDTVPTEDTDPTEPSDDPTEPSDDPTEPSDDPTEPSDDPTEPSDDPTEPSDDPTDPTEAELVVEFDYDVDKDDVQWYHSDNVEFFKDGIVVKSGDTDVTNKAVITFASTPSKVYDGKNFDYTVAFTVLYNGQEVEGKLPVKIAPRGDSDLSAGDSANIYDAVQIAKYILPNPTATIDAGFNTFAADNNEDGKVNIYDAINVATLILPANNGNWDKVSKDHQQWIKD